MKWMKIKITIGICTINPHNALRLLESLADNCKEIYEIIIILDGSFPDAVTKRLKKYPVKLFMNKCNQGLSYNRNFICKEASGEYVLFFDDDVIVMNDIIKRYVNYIVKNKANICGGPLKLCSARQLPSWLPRGTLALIGVHYGIEKIWGANFCFNLKLMKDNNLSFCLKLGRKGNQLQSGDDTTFLRILSQESGEEQKFSERLAVIHKVDTQRFTLKYLLKRCYWQGKSEAYRKNIIGGTVKEIKREFNVGACDFVTFLVRSLIATILLMFFFFGVLRGTLEEFAMLKSKVVHV